MYYCAHARGLRARNKTKVCEPKSLDRSSHHEDARSVSVDCRGSGVWWRKLRVHTFKRMAAVEDGIVATLSHISILCHIIRVCNCHKV